MSDGAGLEGSRQRKILFARKRGGHAQQRRPVAVPSWFDLPVLVPESHPVAARIQRNIVSRAHESPKNEGPSGQSLTPKVSRLTGVYTREEAKFAGAGALKNSLKRRQRVRRLDGLTRVDRKSWLREKLWKDLSRFGLWPMLGPEDATDQQSVEIAVDAIWSQWQENAAGMSLGSEDRSSVGFGVADLEVDTRSSVFLTDVASIPSISTPGAEFEAELSRNQPAAAVDNDESERPENEDNRDNELDQEDDGLSVSPMLGSRTRFQANVQTPGLKRRKRLTDLHRFVETQLQKRLFKGWDSIEIAFMGSGDMTIAQIVKFLQHSDIQLGETDAAKVQGILEKHAAAVQTSQDADNDQDGVTKNQSNQRRGKKQSPLLSYEGFREIFHPVDPQEASRWKREFDRDKFRQRQEKEIYGKELAALEEKVRQRLANSAKHMVDTLHQFKCDPRDVPWENDEQRLQLRSQFLEILLRKPNRRRILNLDNRLSSSSSTATLGGSASSTTLPGKISVKFVLSMLLQKYSRNGHFESIDVPVAAYLYHDFAMDTVKQSIRRFWAKAEIDKWPERQIIFRFRNKKLTFAEWRKFADRSKLLRKHVLRKFVAWKYMTRKLHEYYAFYRISFWPFYVWKRHLQQMIIARGKTTFLMNVLRTYIQLRHFRALKKRYKRKQWNKRHITRIRKKKARQACTICLEAWKNRLESFRLIRQIWRDHGQMLQQLHKYYMVRITFYVLRYYSILKRDMKRREDMTLLSLFSISSRGKAHSPQQRQQQRNNGYTATASNQTNNRHGSLPPYEAHQTGRSLSVDVRNARDSIAVVSGDDDDSSIQALRTSSQNHDPHAESTDDGATASLTRIMETELGKKIKRKSRLYDLCLTLYLKYRERDRMNMIGNVIAYRRFGRIFLKDLRVLVRYNKKNRFSTDLGAFRVLHSRFRQWMIGAIYKVPPPAQGENTVDDDDELEEARDKVGLHWRLDREWRLQGIADNPLHAQRLSDDLLAILENDRVRKEAIRARELQLINKQTNEDTFLRKETGATLKMKAAQMQQVQQIMRRRAHRLHDVMDNVYDALLQQQARQQLKSSFRSLRIAIMMKHTSFLCHRAQIRNWLRLCHRFMYWETHMVAFYQQKLKYHAFQALLKHAVWKWKLQSPGLSRALQRAQQIIWKYELFLKLEEMFNGSPESLRLAGTKFSPANSFAGVFLRWAQFTQCSKARRAIVSLAQRKQQIWLMYSVFYAMKNRVKAKYTYLQRCALLPYLWRQSMVDLDTYQSKIIALEKRLPTTALKARLRHSLRSMQQAAVSSPTLKKLFQDHEKEVRQRLQLEKRLMLIAYNDRAVHNYSERASSLFGTAAGRPFTYEKAPPFSSISEVAVICSKKVDGMSLVIKTNTSASIEGTLHGNAFGTREAFSLARGEKLTTIEGFASQSIYGLRFATSSGRCSKWFGNCEKGTKFEIHSDYNGKREEIVGIFGHSDSSSLNSLGVIMRHTTIKNPLEGLWLQRDHHAPQASLQQLPPRGAAEDLSLSDRQFAYFLQVRACEVLLVMQRAQQFAMRAYSLEATLPPALGSLRIIMALARWMLNALSHGLVHCTDHEKEGKQILLRGQEKRAAGEKLLAESSSTIELIDSFRDAEGQLDAATLGVKKIVELRDMLVKAQQQKSEGEQLMEEAGHEFMLSQRLLPHIPTTKRMISAIRRMYKVVQTKDEIDQMNPELRAILLLKRNTASAVEKSTTPS